MDYQLCFRCNRLYNADQQNEICPHISLFGIAPDFPFLMWANAVSDSVPGYEAAANLINEPGKAADLNQFPFNQRIASYTFSVKHDLTFGEITSKKPQAISLERDENGISTATFEYEIVTLIVKGLIEPEIGDDSIEIIFSRIDSFEIK